MLTEGHFLITYDQCWRSVTFCTDPDPRKLHLHHFSKIKSHKKSQNSRSQGFSYYFCLMIKGSGSERPKNIRFYGSGSGFGLATLLTTKSLATFLFKKRMPHCIFIVFDQLLYFVSFVLQTEDSGHESGRLGYLCHRNPHGRLPGIGQLIC
jgi:hypothetical protein